MSFLASELEMHLSQSFAKVENMTASKQHGKLETSKTS
jgi:hypothetical protein